MLSLGRRRRRSRKDGPSVDDDSVRYFVSKITRVADGMKLTFSQVRLFLLSVSLQLTDISTQVTSSSSGYYADAESMLRRYKQVEQQRISSSEKPPVYVMSTGSQLRALTFI